MKIFEARRFSTFAPMAIAAIGRQSDTMEDRATRVVLRRQPAPRVRSRRIRGAELSRMRTIIGGCLRAQADALAASMAARPNDADFPSWLGDRDADNWQPLVGVAKLAGSPWPDHVQEAIVALCADADAQRTASERLIADIFEFARARRIDAVTSFLEWRRAGRPKSWSPQPTPGRGSPFGAQFAARVGRPMRYAFMPSNELVLWLMDKDDSPIADARALGPGKLKVASMLRGFGIKPGQRWEKSAAVRGYDIDQFKPVWRSYRIAFGGP